LYWTCLKLVLPKAKNIYVLSELCPNGGQGKNTKMFVGSTSLMICKTLWIIQSPQAQLAIM
jgi:hypothetical protein